MFSLIPLWVRVVGAVAIAVGLFASGYARGVRGERATWELAAAKEQAKRAEEQVGIAKELMAWGQANARTALAIADGINAARQLIGENQVRTRYITREITRVVDATPSLAVPLPDRVRELRAEQAAQSAAVADVARRRAEERHRAVSGAGR